MSVWCSMIFIWNFTSFLVHLRIAKGRIIAGMVDRIVKIAIIKPMMRIECVWEAARRGRISGLVSSINAYDWMMEDRQWTWTNDRMEYRTRYLEASIEITAIDQGIDAPVQWTDGGKHVRLEVENRSRDSRTGKRVLSSRTLSAMRRNRYVYIHIRQMVDENYTQEMMRRAWQMRASFISISLEDDFNAEQNQKGDVKLRILIALDSRK